MKKKFVTKFIYEFTYENKRIYACAFNQEQAYLLSRVKSDWKITRAFMIDSLKSNCIPKDGLVEIT